MADLSFNTTAGQTVARELLAAFLNTGTSSTPVWSILGTRVTDSSMEYDWGENTEQDIVGNTYSTMKKPTVTQSFDPYYLDGGDSAIMKIWNLAVKDQDAQALANQDVLIVHKYAGTADTAMFAERYPASMLKINNLGGEGGDNITMPIDFTGGGTRATGTAAISSAGVVTFTADSQ